MKIIHEYPPLIEEIDRVFHVRGKSILYAWGDVIYNPMAAVVPGYLLAHEQAHGEEQGSEVEGWWRRYLVDPEFRLQQEVIAHRAEYKYLASRAINRKDRRAALPYVAKKLSSPLYGRLVTAKKARELLKDG